MKTTNLHLVETIRYGTEKLGVQPFGVFTESVEEIHSRMIMYNNYRGCKYPAYYITKLDIDEEQVSMNGSRRRVDITTCRP